MIIIIYYYFLSVQKAVLTYLLNLSPDEKVQLSTQTQHLQAHLLRTQMSRAQRSSHLQLYCQQVRQITDLSTIIVKIYIYIFIFITGTFPPPDIMPLVRVTMVYDEQESHCLKSTREE